jgi:hypothetical protein
MDEQKALPRDAADEQSRSLLEREEIKLRWYQAKLGFWQALWGTMITGGLAVAIPAYVDAYKTTKQIDLKNLEMDNEYIKAFLSQAVSPDIDLRIRMSQYFSYISSGEHRNGWEKFRESLEKRRNEVQELIINEETNILKIKNKPALSIEDKTQVTQLQKRLDWYEAELGKISTAQR